MIFHTTFSLVARIVALKASEYSCDELLQYFSSTFGIGSLPSLQPQGIPMPIPHLEMFHVSITVVYSYHNILITMFIATEQTCNDLWVQSEVLSKKAFCSVSSQEDLMAGKVIGWEFTGLWYQDDSLVFLQLALCDARFFATLLCNA